MHYITQYTGQKVGFCTFWTFASMGKEKMPTWRGKAGIIAGWHGALWLCKERGRPKKRCNNPD